MVGARRTRAGLARRSGEQEPEGLGEAVAAGSVTLALMTALAFVGFAWERNGEQRAHGMAVDLVERVSAEGPGALLPPWSGYGTGPSSATARDTFAAVHGLGRFAPGAHGSCHVKSRPATCSGSRYDCDVEGSTPAGPVVVRVGLCRNGTAARWSFDALDVTVPSTAVGNRARVEAGRDGLIRYGSGPPPPDVPAPRLHRRGLAMPFVWSTF